MATKFIKLAKGFWKFFFNTVISVISGFVARLLDHLIFEPVREIPSYSLIITVDRPGMGWDIVIYYLITASIVFVASFFIDRILSKIRTTMRYVIIVVISVAVVWVALVKSPLFLTPRVDNRADISGSAYDPQKYYYLFIRPTDSGKCWLQEPIPLMLGHDRKWRTMA